MQLKNVIKKSKTKLGAESIRVGLTDASPMLIIICFIFSLLLLGIIKYNYQLALFNIVNPSVSFWVAILFAVVVQVGRMAFGFVGVRDLARRNWVIGILGISASIAITFFEHTEVNRMVEHWGNDHLRIPLIFLVWITLVFELRLIMTMSGSNESEKEYEEEVKKAQEAEEKRVAELNKQLDNHYKLQYDIKRKEDELVRKQQYISDRQAAMEREAKERQERYNREIEAMKRRRLQEDKERETRFQKEDTERKIRREKQEKEREQRRAKKEAKRKRKGNKESSVPTPLGNEKLNGQPA